MMLFLSNSNDICTSAQLQTCLARIWAGWLAILQVILNQLIQASNGVEGAEPPRQRWGGA